MRVFLLIFAILVAALPRPGLASSEVLYTLKDNTAAILAEPDQESSSKTLDEYLELFFNNCVRANTDETIAEYVELQCACTASEMATFMTPKNMEAFFTETREGNFQHARMIELGYARCLNQTVSDLVLDNCYGSEKAQNGYKRPRAVCQCLAGNMGPYVEEKSQWMIPGYTRNGFDRKQSTAVPLIDVISSRGFNEIAEYFLSKCTFSKEYGVQR